MDPDAHHMRGPGPVDRCVSGARPSRGGSAGPGRVGGLAQLGTTKVVPALASEPTGNVSSERLRVLQITAQFRSADNRNEWGEGFLTAAGSDGLAPGATTETILVKGQYRLHGRRRRTHGRELRRTAKVDLLANTGPRSGRG